MLWVGIDTGGTFTDLVAYNSETRKLISLKTPSTPDDHALGVITAVKKTGIDPKHISDAQIGNVLQPGGGAVQARVSQFMAKYRTHE